MAAILLFGWTVLYGVGVYALPQYEVSGIEPAGHGFQPPGPLDSRSPCPGLNALANHGWLPRSGKNIDYDTLKYAAKQAYNYSEETYFPFFDEAVTTYNLSTTGNSSTLNLRDLARHNTIETDGSLTRNDLYSGDDVHFDLNVFSVVAASLGLDRYSSKDSYVTIAAAAKAYTASQIRAKNANPTFDGSMKQMNGRIGTTALYMATMWDYDAQAAPKAWVKTFLGEDRIPYKEGYKASAVKDSDFIQERVKEVKQVLGVTD